MMKKRYLTTFLPILLTACSHSQVSQSLPETYVKPNQVVTKTIMASQPKPEMKASFHYDNDPSIKAAYQQFYQNGKMSIIKNESFISYPYDGQRSFLIACEPLHLCVVQLEEGENINNIDIGDAANWLISTSMVGTPEKGAYQIAIKPKHLDMATDMVVSTTKRTYSFGLVSKGDNTMHLVTFYYPIESLQATVEKSHQLKNEKAKIATPKIATFTANKLNFNYQLKGSQALWRPVRIFDDGSKTYIELPPMSEKTDLPVFYIKQVSGNELVNYRYKKPYIIVDSLFQTGMLISGKGKHQVRVTIKNIQLQGKDHVLI